MAWVNTQLGNAKRSPDGSYRSIQAKYLAHYLAALQYCSNRLYDLVALAETLLRARSAQRTQPSQSETEPCRRLLPRHAALPNGDQSPATFLLHGDSGSRTARVVLMWPTPLTTAEVLRLSFDPKPVASQIMMKIPGDQEKL